MPQRTGLTIKVLGHLLEKGIALISSAGLYASAGFVIFMALIITVNVILRFCFNKPLLFVEELSGYLLVAIAYLSMAYLVRHEQHIRVDVLIGRLSNRKRNLALGVGGVATLAVLFIFAYFAFGYFYYNLQEDISSMSRIETPMCWPTLLPVVGVFIFILEVAVYTIRKFRRF